MLCSEVGVADLFIIVECSGAPVPMWGSTVDIIGHPGRMTWLPTCPGQSRDAD